MLAASWLTHLTWRADTVRVRAVDAAAARAGEPLAQLLPAQALARHAAGPRALPRGAWHLPGRARHPGLPPAQRGHRLGAGGRLLGAARRGRRGHPEPLKHEPAVQSLLLERLC